MCSSELSFLFSLHLQYVFVATSTRTLRIRSPYRRVGRELLVLSNSHCFLSLSLASFQQSDSSVMSGGQRRGEDLVSECGCGYFLVCSDCTVHSDGIILSYWGVRQSHSTRIRRTLVALSRPLCSTASSSQEARGSDGAEKSEWSGVEPRGAERRWSLRASRRGSSDALRLTLWRLGKRGGASLRRSEGKDEKSRGSSCGEPNHRLEADATPTRDALSCAPAVAVAAAARESRPTLIISLKTVIHTDLFFESIEGTFEDLKGNTLW